ncbi:MAG: adenine nucleotide alpha hydrolase family protein [Candidatus Lokiarchaeota archaeon]|nr:adenine nucleotide alpha hydrolase family protein [Candidatus Lokiarchaeota archaeon]
MTHESPVCVRCKKNRPVMERIHSGEKVCKACFLKEIEDRVRRAMSRCKMAGPDDKVAFAVSGGKDSTVMLRAVTSVHGQLLAQQAKRGRAPVAITVDEGIAGYRDESLRIASEVCKELGIEQVVFSFKKEFGLSLDEMVSAAADPATLRSMCEGDGRRGGQLKNAMKVVGKPCSICGVLRRRVLNDLAAGLQATKLAMGHNLNDEAETFLINLFKGDVNRMGHAASAAMEDDASPFVKKIKPLQDLPQHDVVLYLYYVGGEFQENACPHARENVFRAEAQGILNGLEAGHPGTLFNIKKFLDEVFPLLSRPVVPGTISACPRCGAPKSKALERCMACFYLDELCGKDYRRAMDGFLDRHRGTST